MGFVVSRRGAAAGAVWVLPLLLVWLVCTLPTAGCCCQLEEGPRAKAEVMVFALLA